MLPTKTSSIKPLEKLFISTTLTTKCPPTKVKNTYVRFNKQHNPFPTLVRKEFSSCTRSFYDMGKPPAAEFLEPVSDMLVPKHKGESENKDLRECCGTKFHSVGRGGFSVHLGEGWELPSQVTGWLTTRWGFQSRKKIHFVHSSPSPFQFSCSHKGIKGPSSQTAPVIQDALFSRYVNIYYVIHKITLEGFLQPLLPFPRLPKLTCRRTTY